MSLVLGVDGGNSKAVALLARPDGTIVAAARELGSADIYARGADPAVALTRSVVMAVLEQADAVPSDVERAVFSMAGADWPEDFALLERALGDWGLGGPVTVVNDAIGALAGAIPDGPAVVVNLGTGAATGARGPDGRTWHSSFWQAPQGAGELGRAALAAVVRSELGIQPRTALRDGLLEATGDPDVEALLHRFTARGHPPAAVVGPVVRSLLAAVESGDEAAATIVERHGTGLGEVAAAAARQVGTDAVRYRLAFCGGLARARGAEPLLEACMAAIRSADQTFDRVEPRWQPAVGALVIGLEMGGRLTDDVAARLDATSPNAALYDVLAE